MIEKYLRDSIAGEVRKAKVEQLANLNLMPARIYEEIRYRDSMMHSRDTAYLIEKGYRKSFKQKKADVQGSGKPPSKKESVPAKQPENRKDTSVAFLSADSKRRFLSN